MARFRQAVADRMGFDRARASLDNIAIAHTVKVSKRKYQTIVVKPEPLPADLVAVFAARAGWPANVFRPKAHAWEADHVIAVADGGDWWAMENLMTLCLPCHRAKTNADAVARKARRTAS